MRVMPYPDELSTTKGPMEWIVTQDLYDIVDIVKHAVSPHLILTSTMMSMDISDRFSGRRISLVELETSEAGTRFFLSAKQPSVRLFAVPQQSRL